MKVVVLVKSSMEVGDENYNIANNTYYKHSTQILTTQNKQIMT